MPARLFEALGSFLPWALALRYMQTTFSITVKWNRFYAEQMDQG